MTEAVKIPGQGPGRATESDESLSDDDLVQMDSPHTAEIQRSLLEEDRLESFIRDELLSAQNERREHLDKLANWQEIYRAPPEDSAGDFPFKGASSITIPVVKEVVNTLSSQLLQTILTPSPTWVLKNLADEWDAFKGLIEDFLDTAAERDLDFKDVVEDWILEGTKYGTSIMEVGYRLEEEKRYIYDDKGQKYVTRTEVRNEGPVLFNVPLQDFFIRFHDQDIQDAKWVAKRLRWDETKLKNKASSGEIRSEAVKDLLRFGEPGDEEDEDDVTERHRELEDTDPVEDNKYTVYEFWVSWDLDDGDSLESEILVYWSPTTGDILSARHHPFWHNRRPFVKFVYFPVEHRFYGEGLCEMLEPLQDEITTIHRQRLDNSTLVNIRGVVVSNMIKGLKPGDKLYPGIVLQSPDPARDVVPFQLAEVYPSTFENEQVAQNYVRRVSGVGEAQTSTQMPTSRTTASAQAMLLQEGAKRFDQTIRKVREGIGEAGELVLRLYFQFGAGDKPVMWMGKKGEIVDAIFGLPKRASELGIGLEASAPTSRLNKETQRQNALSLFNLMVQLYERFIELSANVAPDALPLVSAGLVRSAKDFMFDVLETFEGVTDPEDVLAGLSVLESVLPNPEDFGGMESERRGAETDQILDQLGRLEDVLRQTPGDAPGRDRTAQSGADLREFLRSQRISGRGGATGGPSPFAAREPRGGREEVPGRS